MIGDSFEINGKKYTLIKNLTLGEHRKITQVNLKLNKASKNENQDDLNQASDDQLQAIVDFLESHLGLSEDDINSLSMNDAVKIFQKAYELSISVDKDIKKT